MAHSPRENLSFVRENPSESDKINQNALDEENDWQKSIGCTNMRNMMLMIISKDRVA
jgi:hypothetical protein